jgi:hypothetical protein
MLLNTGTWEAAAGNKQLAGWRFEMREAMYGNNTLTCPAPSLLLLMLRACNGVLKFH